MVTICICISKLIQLAGVEYATNGASLSSFQVYPLKYICSEYPKKYNNIWETLNLLASKVRSTDTIHNPKNLSKKFNLYCRPTTTAKYRPPAQSPTINSRRVFKDPTTFKCFKTIQKHETGYCKKSIKLGQYQRHTHRPEISSPNRLSLINYYAQLDRQTDKAPNILNQRWA